MKSKIHNLNNDKLPFETDSTPFFSSAGQRKATRALDELLRGTLDLVYIVGDVGAGKTRVLTHYLANVPDNAKTALIGEQLDSPMEFLHAIAAAYDGMIHGSTTDELMRALFDFLMERHIQGDQFLLAIDNVQNMSDEVFKLLKALTELESRDRRILKIALLSRTNARINRSIRELCQSDDLEALICEITPFTEIETRAYSAQILARDVDFARLQLTTTGGRRIHYYSGGNPRLINILTSLSARIAIKLDQSQITRKIVQLAVRTPRWVSISEAIPGIHVVKVPGNDERGQYAIPKVIVYKDEKKFAEYELDKEKIWIGRDVSSDIRLPDNAVSRRHALVTLEGGNVWISNLNNINGTQVNSKPVLRRVLLDGDVIRVAKFLLLFVYEETAHSSGHLKEATQSDLSAQHDASLAGERENYFELPVAQSKEAEPFDLPAASQHTTGRDEKPSRRPLITVSTIASIGLITGAIVISQSGVEKFDISFPKGGSRAKPSVTEVAPLASAPETDQAASRDTGATGPASTAASHENAEIAGNEETLAAGQAEASAEAGTAVLPPPPTPPENHNEQRLAMQPSPQSESIATPTATTPGSGDSTQAGVPLATTWPSESSAAPIQTVDNENQTVPVIVPVRDIFSSSSSSADQLATITDTDVEPAPRSEAGFEDLVAAIPSDETVYVKDDLKYDNSAILSDRRYDSIDFDWNDIDELLERGHQQIASLKLTVPKGDNAYDTFKAVLEIDPENPEALAGLNLIAERYFDIATASKERLNYRHALKMAKRGLEVSPTDARLQQLKDELTVLAATTQSQPASPTGHFAIRKVPESELNRHFNIARAPLTDLDQPSAIARVSDHEIDQLYSLTEPQYIEPAEAMQQVEAPAAVPTQSPTSQPVFVAQTTPPPTVQTPPAAPAPVRTAPAQSVVRPTVQSPVARTQPPQTRVAAPPAPHSAQPGTPSAGKVATVPVRPRQANQGPGQPVQTASAQPQKIIPNYLSGKNNGQPAVVSTPKPPPVSPETLLNVDHLLKKAERLKSIGHYTGPAGENAYETYKRILSLEPMNPDALIGLLDIADYYYRESEKLMLLGDPLSALAMIEQGLKVRPDHQGLRQLQTNAQLLLAKESKERGLGNKHATVAERKAAREARQIDKLVNDARDRLNEKEFSKSLAIIEQGLKLDPNNPDLISLRSEALQSLASLEKKWGEEQRLREQNLARQQRVRFEVNEMKAQRLLTKARKAYKEGDYRGALNATRNGLTVMPENVELIALKEQIEKTWQRETKKQAAKAVSKVVSGIVAKAKQAHAKGNDEETLRLVNTGLTIDPQNIDLKVLKLEIEKNREIEMLKQQAEAKRRELEALKRQSRAN